MSVVPRHSAPLAVTFLLALHTRGSRVQAAGMLAVSRSFSTRIRLTWEPVPFETGSHF